MFFGTPAWAVPSLDALLRSDIEVAAVVTNPDRPAGRGLVARASPVKARARDAGLDVLQPERARDPGLRERIRRLRPDVAAVVAYGSLLPASLLEIPRLGFVNAHFSLLPAYRGAAPVQRSIMDGAEVTGVSIMVLSEGMDEGPVLATQEVAIEPDDTGATLGERLAVVSGELLVDALHGYGTGALTPAEQDHAAATYAPKISGDEARIDWSRPARAIRDLARALDPEPGAWTTWRGRRLKLFSLEPAPGAGGLDPGQIRASRGLLVGTGTGPVAVREAQPAGKRRMSGEELARGLRPGPGERFE